MNILVTGASGFVASALVSLLSAKDGIQVYAAARCKIEDLPSNSRCVEVGDISAVTDWTDALKSIQVVVHAAARVHIMNDLAEDALTEFRKVNVEGTLNLARQAVEAGVRRFIFISSVKVNGESTDKGIPFLADDHPKPLDAYGISKYEAEQGLHRIAEESGMEVVVIRPPLVYGPGVKGNFASLIHLLKKGLPVPLGAIHNQRTLVALDNLLDLIVTCIDHPNAANQTFLAGDGEDVSTTELLQRLGHALGKPAKLVPIPENVLFFLALLIGKKAEIQRLCYSLQVDISKAEKLLGWVPPISVDDGLLRVAVDFK